MGPLPLTQSMATAQGMSPLPPTPQKMTRCRMIRGAVALGSNVGDRSAHLEFAATRLFGLLRSLRVSRWYETDPVGVGWQPLFLNAAAVGGTNPSARELVDAPIALERAPGRERPVAGA